MRVQFSRARVVTPDWNGNKEQAEQEQLRFEYTPLEYGQWQDAVETLQRLGVMNAITGKPVEITDEQKKEQQELFDLYKRLLPVHVKSVGAPLLPNANDAKQEPITITEIATLMPFVTLATELLATLIAISTPTERDLKN